MRAKTAWRVKYRLFASTLLTPLFLTKNTCNFGHPFKNFFANFLTIFYTGVCTSVCLCVPSGVCPWVSTLVCLSVHLVLLTIYYEGRKLLLLFPVFLCVVLSACVSVFVSVQVSVCVSLMVLVCVSLLVSVYESLQ